MKQATYCKCFIASSVLGPDKARFGRELLLAQLVCLYIVYNKHSDPSLLFVEVMCELLSWKPKGWLRENWQQYTVALAIKETQGILIGKDSIAAENHNRNGTAWTWTQHGSPQYLLTLLASTIRSVRAASCRTPIPQRRTFIEAAPKNQAYFRSGQDLYS